MDVSVASRKAKIERPGSEGANPGERASTDPPLVPDASKLCLTPAYASPEKGTSGAPVRDLRDGVAPATRVRRAQGSSTLRSRGPGSDRCVFLKVTVVEGRAFVGELADERTSSSAVKNFVVDLQFNRQRARTENTVPCCVEPDFGGEAFAFVVREPHELPVNAGAWASFLKADLPLHVALLKQRPPRRQRPSRGSEGALERDEVAPTGPEWSWCNSGKQELVGTAEVDWRRALVPASGAQGGLHKSGSAFLAVELASAAPDSIIHPVGGILRIRVEIAVPQEIPSFPFTVADVTRAMELQTSVQSEARRDFYLYADSWWRDFIGPGSTELRKRSVKIFAQDERGQHRCVCSYVCPYKEGRLLPTPRHAARFVSMLPFQRRASVGDQRLQTWSSPHAFLAAGRGDGSDHVLLLCSLLLGFGLDAFVCVGHVFTEGEGQDDAGFLRDERPGGGCGPGKTGTRRLESDHMWVSTFSGGRREQRVFFWESLTGQRFSMAPPRGEKGRRSGDKKTMRRISVRPHHFSRLACMFNHCELFANKQANDSVGQTSLDISNPSLWKPMDSSRIIPAGGCNRSVSGPAGVVLLPPAIEADSTAEALEARLKEMIVVWRENEGLSTVWDNNMGYLLGPAVHGYEQERVFGACFGNEDFQDAVQGAVPERHCFKGFPTCFDHNTSFDKMMVALLTNVTSKDILQSTGDHLRFALRAMVFPYPDEVSAVWLMLACRYQPRNTP